MVQMSGPNGSKMNTADDNAAIVCDDYPCLCGDQGVLEATKTNRIASDPRV